MTFNSVSEHSLEGFLRLQFDRRTEAEVEAAHRWAELTQELLAANGFRPTRTSVANMRCRSGHTDLALALEHAIDPWDLISPGPYLPG